MGLAIAYLPEIVCILGLVIYSQAPDAKPRLLEAGRIMFFAGLLATLLVGIHHP